MKEKLVRSSNLELFRLVAMLCITLHHFLVHGLENAGYKIGHTEVYATFLNSFFIIGVNGFILISGYFGIKPRLKGFVHLFLTCFLVLLAFYWFEAMSKQSFKLLPFLNVLHPFSKSPYWFIKNYVYLYLLSPILNYATRAMYKAQFIKVLLLTSVFIFYFGWYVQGAINKNGYNVFNFIYLYLLGQYIKYHTTNLNLKSYKYLAIYCVLCLVTFTWAYFYINTGTIEKYIFTYNNPLVIAASVTLFLFFNTINFKNAFVNYIAQSTLIIYLIQDHPLFRKPILKYYLIQISNQISGIKIIPVLIGLAFVFMAGCILVDQFRIYIVKSIEYFLDKGGFYKLEDKVNKYINKF